MKNHRFIAASGIAMLVAGMSYSRFAPRIVFDKPNDQGVDINVLATQIKTEHKQAVDAVKAIAEEALGKAKSGEELASSLMRQCRITIDEGDDVALPEVTALLEGYIGAAVTHLEGWNGTLGGVVVIGEQVWKQEFDAFSQCLKLPLSPVASIESVTWRNSAGQISTISASEYTLKTDAAGVSACRFRNSYSFPSDLYEIASIAVTYKAGYSPIPTDIRQAILLLVGAWYENREETVIGVPVASLPVSAAVETLIFPYRRNII